MCASRTRRRVASHLVDAARQRHANGPARQCDRAPGRPVDEPARRDAVGAAQRPTARRRRGGAQRRRLRRRWRPGAGRAPGPGRALGGRPGRDHPGLVRRYETVLGLPEGQLLAAIDFFSRSRNPVRPAATLSPPGPPDVDATLVLLEKALGEERMSGLEWDRLSDSLGRMPHAMVRAGDWERLLRRRHPGGEPAPRPRLRPARRGGRAARRAPPQRADRRRRWPRRSSPGPTRRSTTTP